MTVRIPAPKGGPARPGHSVRPPDIPLSARDALHPGNRARRGWRQIVELPLLVVAALVVAMLVKALLVQPFYIPSGSMQPTLDINDRVLVEKVTYRVRDPRRGEILVFRRPGAEDIRSGVGGAFRSLGEGLGLIPPDEEIDLIKRVIGLPGEEVALTDGALVVDGVHIDEPYAVDDGRDFGPVALGPDEYLMLGDNRPNSDDSRFSVGLVGGEDIIGRALVIIWPVRHATFELHADYAEPAPEAGAD